MANKKSARFLAFSCTHCPLQDDNAIEWVIEQIKAHKPNVLVHLGDGHEADSASRWPSENCWDLETELATHNRLLRDLRAAAPKGCQLVFCEGNHDANLLALHRIDRKLRGLCDYRRHEEELRFWKQIPYLYDRHRGVFRLGQVTFAHGYEAAQNADEMQSLLLGVPYGLSIHGHTHRLMPVSQAHKTKAVPLPYWFANPGCTRDLKPEFMHRKRTHQWGQGCIVGSAEVLPVSRLVLERRWDAELRVFKSYDDWSGAQ